MTVDDSVSSKVNQGQSKELKEEDHETKEEEKTDNDTPKGKVSCLLCRGFISYKNSDRSRFRDHMESEHDVQFDSDVILAVSVMSKAEKQFIVESAVKRLGEIGNNQTPTSGDALLPRPPIPPTPPITAPSPVPPPSSSPLLRGGGRGRGRGGLPAGAVISPMVGRGRGRAATYRGNVLRPVRPAAPLRAPLPPTVPLSVQNMSISISVVDQTVKCSQCPDLTFKNSR